jgi:hypothetical protein
VTDLSGKTAVITGARGDSTGIEPFEFEQVGVSGLYVARADAAAAIR